LADAPEIDIGTAMNIIRAAADMAATLFMATYRKSSFDSTELTAFTGIFGQSFILCIRCSMRSLFYTMPLDAYLFFGKVSFFTMKMIGANPVHFHRSWHDLGSPDRSATFFGLLIYLSQQGLSEASQ
jgi:hypothetical protein